MRLVSYILLLLLSVGLLRAQDRRMSPEQRRERVETVIIGKFADELELSPLEAEKFYPRLRQFRTETEPLQREFAATQQRIDELSRSGESEGRKSQGGIAVTRLSEGGMSKDELKALIAKSNALQTEILTKRELLLTDLADFLSPQQVSRCSILLDELPRRIRQFMEDRGGPPHQGDRERGIEHQKRRRTR